VAVFWSCPALHYGVTAAAGPATCAGAAAHVQAAFEHCVRAYVIRSECMSLGPQHPDTAAAGHNLGVVLDSLGNSSRALELLEAAQQVSATF